MGLLVHTSFETSQGIPVTNVYLRICSITSEFINRRAYVTIKCESHINREKRLEGKHALYVPNIPTYFNIDTPLDSGWNDIAYLYNTVKSQLTSSGFDVVEDVFEPEPEPTPEETEVSQQSSESTQTTLPTLPPPEESAPQEQQTEPQPQ